MAQPLLVQASIEPPRGPLSARELSRELRAYRDPRVGRSITEILITAIPLVILAAGMWVALAYGQVWLYLLLMLPTAGFLVRLFMIQHDCGHGSFFSRRGANDWTGRIIGVLTLTPYDHWRGTHATHHAGTGNLSRRGIGDIRTLTTEEYAAASRWERFGYRLYRNPLVLFLLGPSYLFVIYNRWPSGMFAAGRAAWLGTIVTNLVLAGFIVGMMWALGVAAFLLVYVPVMILSASIGVWLFYVQHQFERTHWAGDEDWDALEAALNGSSHYELPGVLRWFTANIGIHHVHHLCSRIPYYRLPQVLRDYPQLRGTSRLTLWHSLRCVPLTLWHAGQNRLISFREYRAEYRAGRIAAQAA